MNRPARGESAQAAARRVVEARAWAGTGILFLTIVAWWSVTPSSATGDPPSVAAARFRVDPNEATKEELMLLPGIGDALSDAIIEYRETRLPERAFMRAEDLDRVYRIGPVTVAKLEPFWLFPKRSDPPRNEETSRP